MDDIPAERVDVWQNNTTGEIYRIYPDDPVLVNPDTGQKFLRPRKCLNCDHAGQRHILKKGLLGRTSIVCRGDVMIKGIDSETGQPEWFPDMGCGCKNFVLTKYCLYCGQEEIERFHGLLGDQVSEFDCLSSCDCTQCVHGVGSIDCPRCEGTGECYSEWHDSDKECPTCKGYGAVREEDRCSKCGTFECETGCMCDWCVKHECRLCGYVISTSSPCWDGCRCTDCVSKGIAPECDDCGEIECTNDCYCGDAEGCQEKFLGKLLDDTFINVIHMMSSVCLVCDKAWRMHTREEAKDHFAKQKDVKQKPAYRRDNPLHSALPKGFKPKES